jgi:hypothetical protein
MSGNIDFRSRPVRRQERRVKLSCFDSIVFAIEINCAFGTPKGMTDRQKLLGASVSIIVFEVIPKAALLRSRAPGDNIEGDPPPD